MMQFTDRQQEIIEISIELIAKKGIQSLTIKNIARQMGVTEPALYRHFTNKMDILLSILDYFEDRARGHLKRMLEQEGNSLEKLEGIVSSHCKNFSARPTMAVVIFSEEIFRNDPRLSEKVFSIMKLHQEAMEKIIGEGQSRGEIRQDISEGDICLLVLGALRLLVTRWRMSRFGFDLLSEGQKMCLCIQKIVKAN